MDAISYAHSAKQEQRIKKFINDPDSTSGIVTVPKVIASGESVTIPAGRVAVLPNVQVDGTLNIDGEVFIPSGATFGDLDAQIALKADISYVNTQLGLKANTADLKELGVGQTWQDMTSQRSIGVTYTNNTGKPIIFGVVFRPSGLTYWQGSIIVQGIGTGEFNRADGTDTNRSFTLTGVVPAGGTYSATIATTGALNYWFELR